MSAIRWECTQCGKDGVASARHLVPDRCPGCGSIAGLIETDELGPPSDDDNETRQRRLERMRQRAEQAVSATPERKQSTMGEDATSGKSERACNVPGCGKPAAVRGLCHMHNTRRHRAKNPDQQAEAVRYVDPPKRGGKRKARAASPKGVGSEAKHPQAKHPQAKPGAIAPASGRGPNGLAVLAALGGSVVETAEGRLLLRDGKLCGHIAADGTVRRAEISLGEVVTGNGEE